MHRISEASPSEEVRSLVAALAVEPPPIRGDVTSRFVVANTAKLQLLTVMRKISELKSRLQRRNPLEHPEECNRLFGELVALEQLRRGLREQAIGAL